MTLLIFDQWETGVDIYTDTIVTDADHNPVGHATKVWTFPHLRLAMTVTGTKGIGETLGQQIRLTPHLRDIDDVDTLTPDALRTTHQQLTTEYGDIGTATVYLFGFPDQSDELTCCIYRSTRDYQSERSTPTERVGIKPPPAETVDPNLDIIGIANQILDENVRGIVNETIPIGGQLIRTRLQPDGFTIGRVHTFPEDATDWHALRELSRTR